VLEVPSLSLQVALLLLLLEELSALVLVLPEVPPLQAVVFPFPLLILLLQDL